MRKFPLFTQFKHCSFDRTFLQNNEFVNFTLNESDTIIAHFLIIEEPPVPQEPSSVFIPNAFTPNGDNHNETFYVHGADKDDIESMVIYNRWGEKVYETFDNTPWDGYNCQVGVYSYSIRTHNQHYTGQVSLIK